MNPGRSASNDELSKAVSWLQQCIVSDARGDGVTTSDRAPSTLYWLGRLAPECEVLNNRLGDRGERLEPCAIGMRLRPIAAPPWNLTANISMHAWSRAGKANPWTKSGPIALTLDISISSQNKRIRVYQAELENALHSATGRSDLGAAIDISTEVRNGIIELVIELVNVSEPTDDNHVDCNIYECSLQVKGLRTQAFTLEGLPDAFRYDRDLPAIGLNCSVYTSGDGVLKTTDTPEMAQLRPNFVPEEINEELLSFHRLSADPRPSANALVRCHTEWGKRNWSQEILSVRAEAEHWTVDMIEAASQARAAFLEENRRLADGTALLHSNDELRSAFALMNDAMARSARGRYPGWRAFQLGFLLANLGCIEASPEESDIADIVWFATGGGKTETYLGLLIIAMIRDRMRGKLAGITAWSRFPLRMLSLQQTQRFADAIAAAELVRRDNRIPGSPFSLGYFVGQGATPNNISPEPEDGQPNPYDDEMAKRFQVLGRCPFCGSESIEMAFDQTYWTLQHRCNQAECPWPEIGLPFYVVDEEIYRFLPTVVVGTLDKAASISMQAAMRGFVGSPLGVCSKSGHGFTYAVRSKRPTGCLVPGCRHPLTKLTSNAMDFAPSFRLQDELHLLRDSLGAVDAHYEALYDHLSYELSNRRPKILGSSATLAGYERQVSVLYAREARVFPQPGPAPGVGFWSSESQSLMRHFVALAPRGVTLEHAVDRTMTVLQRSIRRLVDQPEIVSAEIGIPTEIAWQVIDLYGTNVVYGNTLRDLDAVSRSAETQILVDGDVIQRSLTGRTDFAEVRQTLRDLEEPPADFKSRIHVVMASSMMSHGVDIDRLNVMVMVGLPLGTAEFIQATARVGRRYPGLVIVAPKMGRERDAAVYRTFPKFVEHADRLVEPIPITRRSRRVLQRTMAGLEMARVLMIHEPASGRSLALPRELRKYWDSIGFDLDAESHKLIEALDLTGELDGPLHREVRQWMEGFMRNLKDPPADVRFVSQASPSSGPMRSLRDVEESVSIYGKEENR